MTRRRKDDKQSKTEPQAEQAPPADEVDEANSQNDQFRAGDRTVNLASANRAARERAETNAKAPRKRQRGPAVKCPRPGCDGDCFVYNTRRYPDFIETRRRNYRCAKCNQTFSAPREVGL